MDRKRNRKESMPNLEHFGAAGRSFFCLHVQQEKEQHGKSGPSFRPGSKFAIVFQQKEQPFLQMPYLVNMLTGISGFLTAIRLESPRSRRAATQRANLSFPARAERFFHFIDFCFNPIGIAPILPYLHVCYESCIFRQALRWI